jgi:hypothetical protein
MNESVEMAEKCNENSRVTIRVFKYVQHRRIELVSVPNEGERQCLRKNRSW